jgi:hypothetical protein
MSQGGGAAWAGAAVPFHFSSPNQIENEIIPLHIFLSQPNMKMEPFHYSGMDPFHYIPPRSITKHTLKKREMLNLGLCFVTSHELSLEILLGWCNISSKLTSLALSCKHHATTVHTVHQIFSMTISSIDYREDRAETDSHTVISLGRGLN